MRTFVFLYFLLVSCASAGQVATEVEYSTLKGRVKSVHENSYAAHVVHRKEGNDIVKGHPRREYASDKDYLIVFDSTGKKVRKYEYTMHGKISAMRTYQYDEHGFMTKECHFNRKVHIIDSTTFTNIYNVSGQLAKRIVHYAHSKSDAEFWYAQDATGNIYESFITSKEPPVTSRNTRTFDRKWHVKIWWTYNNEGKPESKHTYTYNEAGNVTADSVYFNGNTTPGLICKWKYDEKETLVRYDVCNPAGLNCESWTYTYDYDSTGNWVKSVVFRNGKAAFVKERTITYF